ncbi:MAG: nuclear transport factor 2 family protein [Steroidobacteraceae bacterium]
MKKVMALVAAVGLCTAWVGTTSAQEKVTAESLIDRQQILDQITRYYYNFGKAERQSEESFYADDGVLILGTKRYEGREGIKSAYNRPPPAPAADAAPATPAAPRERLPFNITVDNALIVVHGETATSQVIFTEYRPEKKGDPMKMTTQGKEYGTWVKVKGQWLYKTRQIAGGSEPPAGWKE